MPLIFGGHLHEGLAEIIESRLLNFEYRADVNSLLMVSQGQQTQVAEIRKVDQLP